MGFDDPLLDFTKLFFILRGLSNYRRYINIIYFLSPSSTPKLSEPIFIIFTCLLYIYDEKPVCFWGLNIFLSFLNSSLLTSFFKYSSYLSGKTAANKIFEAKFGISMNF